MRKEVVIIAVTTTLLAALPMLASAQTTVTQSQSIVVFSDIDGHLYEAEILEATSLGYITGFPDQTFQPEQVLTREEAISVIIDAANSLYPIEIDEAVYRNKQLFSDVDETRWSAAKINWFQENFARDSIDSSLSTFRPGEPVTRIEILRFLRSAARNLNVNLTGSSSLTPTQDPIQFSDVAGPDIQLTRELSAFCRVASPLNEEGDRFAPTDPATRAYGTAAILRTMKCVLQNTQATQ